MSSKKSPKNTAVSQQPGVTDITDGRSAPLIGENTGFEDIPQQNDNGNDIYSDPQNDLLTNALNYFYQNRAGLDITQDCITSGNVSR